MKPFIFVCISIFSFVFANAIEFNLKPQNIHVLLEKNVNEALLEVRGPYYIFNPYGGTKISSGILGKRFMVRAIAGGLKWGQEFLGFHQLVIIPRSSETTILLNGIQYDGAIAVYKVGNALSFINEINVESYLKAILSTQFQYPLDPEAMAAVAIAARTTSYFQIYKSNNSYWHVNGKDINYQGTGLIIPKSDVATAVEVTKNLILLNQKNEKNIPFKAFWTEHCGGKTASVQAIFRKDCHAPQGIEAPHAALDRKETRWSYSIPVQQIANFFNINKITSIDLFQDTSSNKVYAVRLKEDSKTVDVDFLTLQKKLGKNNLKSNDFSVYLQDKQLHFAGYGRGHGVGLCLYSASVMAQNGDIAIKILSKFFPNTFIYNLSSKYLQKDKKK